MEVYCRFISTQKEDDRKRIFYRIFKFAKQVAINHKHFDSNNKAFPAIEILIPHLTADVLYCSGITPEEESWLDYFMLATIQLWLLRRKLENISTENLYALSMEIQKSIERGFSEKRLYAVLSVIPTRERAAAN